MRVGINPTRNHIKTSRIYNFIGAVIYIEVFTNGHNFPIFNENVCDIIIMG